MTMIKQLLQWLNSCFFYSGNKRENIKNKEQLPPVKFNYITKVERPPINANVKKDELYLIATGQNHKWALFQCPCGCGHVITLSLQSAHNPHWKLSQTTSKHPTLYPSIWQDTSCFSHFWLKDGRIYWCQDSGTPPWQEKNRTIKY